MRLVLAGAALVLLAVGCGGSSSSSSGSSGAPIKTVQVKETEFKLDPASISLDKAGTYTFEAVNNGSFGHALEIEGKGVEQKTRTIDGGQSATLTVKLEPGTYEIYCPVDNHRAMGMEGKVVVAGSSSGGGGGTTTQNSGGYGY